MEVNTVVVDTNAYVEFKKGNPDAINIVKMAKNMVFCPIVIGELLSGFLLGNKEEQNRVELKQFLDSKRVISVIIDNEISEEFALIFKELRTKGKPIPTNDMWIAATARRFGFSIFTYDGHFENVSGVKIVSKPDDLNNSKE